MNILPSPRLIRNIEETRSRLLSKSEDSGDCRLWAGYVDKEGYGRIWIEGHSWSAHRAAFTAFVAPITNGRTVDHLCFQTLCIKPTHLRLLTLSENAKNQRSAYRTHCIHGHEFTPENTYWRPSSGRRDCRACGRLRSKRYLSGQEARAVRAIIEIASRKSR